MTGHTGSGDWEWWLGMVAGVDDINGRGDEVSEDGGRVEGMTISLTAK